MQSLHSDWKFAHQHGQSTKPGLKNSRGQFQCICCLRSVNKEPIPLCENSKQLQFLGYGFPLYFIFLKYAMIILFLETINYSIINLYKAVNQNYDFCIAGIPKVIFSSEVHCSGFMVFLANINDQVSGSETILRITSFITLLFYTIYIRDNFTKTWRYYDERQTSFADFSVLV